MTFSEEFCYLNSSSIKKSITLMFMSSSRGKFTVLWQNLVTDVSVGFRLPCWSSSRWAPAWHLHTKLYELGLKHFLGYYSFNLNLGKGLFIFTSFHFLDSRLYLSDGFDLYFDRLWMAWHWKPAIDATSALMSCHMHYTCICQWLIIIINF